MPISFQPISMPMFWLISESHRSGKIDQCQKKRPNTGEHSRPTVGGIGNDHPASGCCSNPDFPKAWRREFSRIFPNEKVKAIAYDHLIYRSFYKIDRVRCLHEARDIQLEGLFFYHYLLAVMCEDGLCCAFSANNTCNTGRGVSPEDGQKLTLNIAVYALRSTFGLLVDCSRWRPAA